MVVVVGLRHSVMTMVYKITKYEIKDVVLHREVHSIFLDIEILCTVVSNID